MERIAQIMFVNLGCFDEYQKRHQQLWPEMESTLLKYGARNYSIFLNPNNGQLFAYLEVASKEKYNQIVETDVCQKWWKYMEPIMETNSDNSPIVIDLKPVFHLNEGAN